MRFKAETMIVLLCIVTLLISIPYVLFFTPKNKVDYYYSLINNQEKTDKEVTVSEEDINQLKKCRSIGLKKNDCISDFYQKYTLKNGVNSAFSHLALLQKIDPTFIGDCHYISHGIGHAELKRDGNDVSKSFSVMTEANYYKNVATCGNGYFHGVMEEYAKYTTNKKSLVKLLTGVCDSVNTTYSLDCYHGMGHSAFVQLDLDTKNALSICDEVSDNKLYNFACYTGVFMEITGDFSTNQMIEVKDGIMNLKICNSVEEKYRQACYDQHSYLLGRFTKNPKDFVNNIKYCQQINNEIYRLHCIKLFAGRSVRILQVKDIKTMCIENTKTERERLECVGFFARRISTSIDRTLYSKESLDAVNDICKILPILEQKNCIETVRNHPIDLYFVKI